MSSQRDFAMARSFVSYKNISPAGLKNLDAFAICILPLLKSYFTYICTNHYYEFIYRLIAPAQPDALGYTHTFIGINL
jgi:hypothetical protein